MAIFVTGNGNYNSLFSKIFKIFDYFCTVVPYFKYFRVIFVNSSFAFTSAFVSQNFREYGTTVYFRVQIWIRKKFCFIFRENGKSGKKILSHCLTYQICWQKRFPMWHTESLTILDKLDFARFQYGVVWYKPIFATVSAA